MKISDLPGDLESEILARVPAKSLAKAKAKDTCKRWYALLRDPKFVEKNKKLGKAVRESMLLSDFRVFSVGDDLHGIHKNGVGPSSIEFTGKLSSVKDSKELRISRIFHCDGLILCSGEGKTSLVLWNPCTGQRRNIEPRTCYRREDTYAIGYVSSSSLNSYKILRSCYYQNEEKDPVAEFEIYELSSGSWRVLDHLTRDYDLEFSDSVSLKGDAYFVAVDEKTGFFLMKFDFTTERFVRLPLPFQTFDPKDTVALSVVKDEKLSVLHQKILAWSNVMKIWVTNKVDDEAKDLSWRSDFVLVVDFDNFFPLSVSYVASFLLDEENKVAVCCDTGPHQDKTRVYTVGETTYKRVYEETTKASPLNWPHVLTYVPSLVSP